MTLVPFSLAVNGAPGIFSLEPEKTAEVDCISLQGIHTDVAKFIGTDYECSMLTTMERALQSLIFFHLLIQSELEKKSASY